MNNVEQEEAKKTLDSLAREIHGIYGQHAADAGLKTPKWEELPEPAKGISRDLSRLVLAKMQEAYVEGQKLGEAEKAVTKLEKAVDAIVKPSVVVPLPKSWSVDDALKFIKGAKSDIEELVRKVARSVMDERRVGSVQTGLDRAISQLTEKITLDVIQENPELLAKLRQVVERDLMEGLLGKDDEKEE